MNNLWVRKIHTPTPCGFVTWCHDHVRSSLRSPYRSIFRSRPNLNAVSQKRQLFCALQRTANRYFLFQDVMSKSLLIPFKPWTHNCKANRQGIWTSTCMNMKVSVCFPEEDVLAKQVADQMIKKYPAVIWTRMFITMLTKVNQHTGALPAQVVKTWNV